MAEDIVCKEKSLEELERDITCSICQEHYTEPKVLPCLHYYCKKCILKLALRRGTSQPFSCPECRKETTLPEGGVDELKTAFFIHHFKSMYSTVERVRGKVKCEGCTDSGDKAEALCRQCAVFICKECIKQHKRMKAFSSHDVDSLEDLKQGRTKEIAVKEPPIKKCHTHEEPLMIYCFDCNSFICRDCTVTAHGDHHFEFSKVAAPNTKKKLLEELDPLREISVCLSQAAEEVQTTKHEVEAQGRTVADTIQTSFDELHKILEKRRQEMLSEAEGLVQEKIEKLSVQEKNLSLANKEVQSIIDYTERFVSHCSDDEVVSMHDELSSQIKNKIEGHGKADMIMEPVEEADMGVEVRCAEALQQLCQAQAKITRLPLVGSVIQTSTYEVNTLSEVTLSIRHSNNQPLKRRYRLDVHMKSLCNGSSKICHADQTSAGKYSIKFTPTVRGRHELTASVDRQQVAGSPFPLSVSISPVQLEKPVRILSTMHPSGVAVNSLGEVLVAEMWGNIIKFVKRGSKQILVKQSQSQLKKLSGIAVDSEDDIYVVNEEDPNILKCNKNGGNLQMHVVQQVKGPGHWGVAVVGDEVMVCERNNTGTVVVYDRELKYVRHIKLQSGGNFRNLSSDEHGNLYVTDFADSCIQVFRTDGSFLRSFGCDSNGLKKLSNPYGICVSSQHVYVTSWSGDGVSVFTIAGDYVWSFGQWGFKEGEFSVPCGLCVDSDNFLYVSDYCNFRVQCF